MGQQQLLLVILVTIIVGIATVVAINTFSSASESAQQDAVRQDLASIAAAAQGFYMKPTMLGGGNRTFTGVTFNDLAFPAEEITSGGSVAKNANGTYTLSVQAQELTVTGVTANGKSSIVGTIGPDEYSVAAPTTPGETGGSGSGGTD